MNQHRENNNLAGQKSYATALLPSPSCLFCGQKLSETGGKRIVAQNNRGLRLSNAAPQLKSNPTSVQSIELPGTSMIFIEYWGEEELWTEEAIRNAKTELASGRSPWFCQACGKRLCDLCGYPVDLPMGSDVMDDSGNITHVAILSCDPGCSNPRCEKYRENRV